MFLFKLAWVRSNIRFMLEMSKVQIADHESEGMDGIKQNQMVHATSECHMVVMGVDHDDADWCRS